MATYFGEILEPTSRAIFEEFSDEEEEVKPIDFQFSWFQETETLPETLSTVYIYHGKLSVAFAEAFLLPENSEPNGEISIVDTKEESDNELTFHRCKLLPSRIYLENNVLTCLVSPTHSADVAFQFVNSIVPILGKAKRIIIFTNETYYNYKTATLKDLPPAFIRELKTSHSNYEYLVKELPMPNIVAGIPAAIASWCQIYKKDASLFICYADQQKLDSVTAAPYLSVIGKLNSQLIKNSNPDLTKKRFYGNSDIIGGSSNLYI